MTGMGRYATGLTQTVRALFPDVEYVPLEPTGLLENWLPTGVRKDMRTVVWELFGLGLAAKNAEVDVLHCLYWASPLFPATPTLVTIPDVVALLPLPDFGGYRRGIDSWCYYHLVSFAARRCRLVIGFSEAAAQDTAATLKIPVERFVITPIPPEDRFRPVTEPYLLEEVRRKHGIPGDFVLCMASAFDYRRNIRGLIKGFAWLRSQIDEPVVLVVAGDLRALERPHCPDPRPVVREVGLREGIDVLFPGYIDDDDLPALYSAARLHVCPSVYEGFGLTPLESMACRTPVVASDIATFRETLGSAALLVDTEHPPDFGRAMLEVWTSRELMEDLVSRGGARVDTLSWREAARRTVDAYSRAVP